MMSSCTLAVSRCTIHYLIIIRKLNICSQIVINPWMHQTSIYFATFWSRGTFFGLFFNESLANNRCDWCLACLSFSVRIVFVMFECNGVVRGVGSLWRDAWEFSEGSIIKVLIVRVPKNWSLMHSRIDDYLQANIKFSNITAQSLAQETESEYQNLNHYLIIVNCVELKIAIVKLQKVMCFCHPGSWET